MHLSVLKKLSNIKIDLGLTEPEFILLCSVCSFHWTIRKCRKELKQNIVNVKEVEKGLLKKFECDDLVSVVIMIMNCYRSGPYKDTNKVTIDDILRFRRDIKNGYQDKRKWNLFNHVFRSGSIRPKDIPVNFKADK